MFYLAHLLDHGLSSVPVDENNQATILDAEVLTRTTRSIGHKSLLDIYLSTMPSNDRYYLLFMSK